MGKKEEQLMSHEIKSFFSEVKEMLEPEPVLTDFCEWDIQYRIVQQFTEIENHELCGSKQ
jgi:hypothetical protein